MDSLCYTVPSVSTDDSRFVHRGKHGAFCEIIQTYWKKTFQCAFVNYMNSEQKKIEGSQLMKPKKYLTGYNEVNIGLNHHTAF